MTHVERAALFTTAHTELLASAAIDPEHAFGLGVRSALTAADLPPDVPAFWSALLPGLLFPWRDETGHVEWQLRPDVPRSFEPGGEPAKYLLRSREQGFRSTQWVLRRPTGSGPVLFVEGTKQCLAAAEHAPEGMGVVGLVGCWGGSDRGLPARGLAIADGRDVFVCLDADYTVNPKVWDAGDRLTRALSVEGARSVKFVRLPAGGKTGLDDVLAGRDPAGRRLYLARLIQDAEIEKFAKSNRPRKAAVSEAGALFDPLNGFMAASAAQQLYAQSPMALTKDHLVAVYDQRKGVYRVGEGAAFEGAVAALLGEQHRSSYVATVRQSLYHQLADTVIPEKTTSPLLNVANGLVDITTGQVHPHTPEHLTTVQLPVSWPVTAEQAACPVYLEWLTEAVGPEQLEGLEETAGAMLDPRFTPSKAIMLFGPSRSGKSTFLRLLEAIAGDVNTSSVSLHQLADDQFAAANVYGKVLNSSADLSAKDVSDLSVFKMMTGDDTITANRKYGRQFSFRNKALFAFSANALPTVGEASRAYLARVRPVKFAHSFIGREDPRIEQAMLRELPGILMRLAAAHVRRLLRGADAPLPEAVATEFGTASNSAAQWFSSAARLPDPAEPGITGTEMHIAYTDWARTCGRVPLGRTKFMAAMRSITPDLEFRDGGGRRMWRVRPLPPSEWTD